MGNSYHLLSHIFRTESVKCIILASVIKTTVIYYLQSQVETYKRTNSSAGSGNTRSLDKL